MVWFKKSKVDEQPNIIERMQAEIDEARMLRNFYKGYFEIYRREIQILNRTVRKRNARIKKLSSYIKELKQTPADKTEDDNG